MKKLALSLFLLAVLSCESRSQELVNDQQIRQSQDSIIAQHLKNGAHKHSYYSPEWQDEIDQGLAKDSTIAYLWQQKAMPYFKQGKYEVGMEFIDKAVQYDRRSYQEYRAFIKCIFAKTYREAIADFEDCKARFGYSYVQDHSYDFYIALCKIQLNEFEAARDILAEDLARLEQKSGPDVIHHLDVYYLGICYYELGQYEQAVETFDWAIKLYSQFSDAQYYKALSLQRMGQKDKARELYAVAKANAEQGYTINEDNAIYERYPYQVRWHNH